MRPPVKTKWQEAFRDLAAWHTHQDHAAANRALSTIESWLRTRIPPAARSRWSHDEIDDAIQGFLERLLNKPLPDNIDDPRAYLGRAWRNWCISRQRGRKTDKHAPWDEDRAPETTRQAPDIQQRLARASEALETLSIKDRVVIKLVDLPWALSWKELTWLGQRSGRSATEVRDAVMGTFDKLELSLIFDPGPPPTTPKERRDRLERFRRRRSRAREKLKAAVEVNA